jgi:hypothetical protein
VYFKGHTCAEVTSAVTDISGFIFCFAFFVVFCLLADNRILLECIGVLLELYKVVAYFIFV